MIHHYERIFFERDAMKYPLGEYTGAAEPQFRRFGNRLSGTGYRT
jgi:hypothetical protein